ncbi:MAG: hypothetical protein RL693_2254 [Verrucomicrobiota bacterium]
MAAITLTSSMAFGQATRTWVSGVGDDVNPCSRTAPGKTFAGAISKTAAGGEIDALDPGGFGAVTITKSITIDGGPNAGGILAAGTNGVVINAGVNGVVTLRNLSINGVGTGLNGVRILAAAEVNIENCVIVEFTQLGIDINTTAACRVNIKNTIVRGCNTGAVHSQPAAGGVVVTVDKSHFLHSQGGFRATNFTTATINDSVLSGNSGSGVVVGATLGASRVNVHNCVASDNGSFGLVAVGALSTVVAGNNVISQNATGVGVLTGGSLVSFGNNRNNGNTVNGAPTSTIAQQ